MPDFQGQPWVASLTALALLVVGAVLAHLLTRQVLAQALRRLFVAPQVAAEQSQMRLLARRLAGVAPALVVARGAALVPHIPAQLLDVAQNVCAALIVLQLTLAAGVGLSLVNEIYQRRPEALHRPIKGYLQVLKIVLYAGCAVLMAAALMERSPVLLLSGLGAMAAVLMLIFKDTILALVASVQLSSNDMLRVGDWIEMPQLNVDGDVIDIALHTVKVQNWDKTIATIPTHRLIGESFKNWRGMQESGGRRIKRALHLDQASIHFLTAAECADLRRFALLDDYLDRKLNDLESWNANLPASRREPVNIRRLTNVGTFRAYVHAYLTAHPGIAQDMTLLVRQMQSAAHGLPLEIYAFTNTTAWAEYEAIQSDIFDHLIAILPEFGLRIFQAPSGADLKGVEGHRSGAPRGATPRAFEDA